MILVGFIFWKEKRKMVGTTGFEPATSPTPRVRDTRLRYVPTGSVNYTAATHAALQFSLDSQGYHPRSRSVKKARKLSRISSSIFRLKRSAGVSPLATEL